MTPIADTGPLNYLILIGEVRILPVLFSGVIIPHTVACELGSSQAPDAVRNWIENPPPFLKILDDPPDDESLDALDPGERCAITLAISLNRTHIIMDDLSGRREAEWRQLQVTGTLGLIASAHRRGLLDFGHALDCLSRTSFYLSPRIVAAIRQTL
jgi:predicted nucleic acid-binding protein